MKDLFGMAMLDFITNNGPQNLITETNISEPDEMSVAYLFRNYEQMPPLEKKALALVHGSVLDIGCGAGSHLLYLQNEKKLEVKGIDSSKKAVETCNKRGLQNIENVNIFDFETNQKFDTIILLMNGIGVCGKLEKIDLFLQKLNRFLNNNGQILIDSSNIIYMFDEEDATKIVSNQKEYYGDLEFTITYKNQTESFDWLFLDFETLSKAANANHLNCELVFEGENFDYLAKLSKKIP
jgi:2-polyprenyl-3-methyl-5-hydroxy-6-metoxy-1,4-benzoquinol methylase